MLPLILLSVGTTLAEDAAEPSTARIVEVGASWSGRHAHIIWRARKSPNTIHGFGIRQGWAGGPAGYFDMLDNPHPTLLPVSAATYNEDRPGTAIMPVYTLSNTHPLWRGWSTRVGGSISLLSPVDTVVFLMKTDLSDLQVWARPIMVSFGVVGPMLVGDLHLGLEARLSDHATLWLGVRPSFLPYALGTASTSRRNIDLISPGVSLHINTASLVDNSGREK